MASKKKPVIKLLTFDPGLSNSGWALLEYNPNDGSILTKLIGSFKATSEATKVVNNALLEKYGTRMIVLQIVKREIKDVLEKHQPDYIVTEGAFWNPKFPSAYQALTQWILLLRLAAYDLGKTVYEIPTRIVKRCVSGNGGALKTTIQEMITSLPGMNIKAKVKPNEMSLHESDALAVGYTFCIEILPEILEQNAEREKS